MGVWSWLRGLIRGSDVGVDYSYISDETALELAAQRDTLTDDAKAKLDAELARRNLKLPVPEADDDDDEDDDEDDDDDDEEEAHEAPKPAQAEPTPDGLTKRWPPTGPIQSVQTTRAIRIQGVPCAAETLVTFHRNGRVSTAHLAIDWTCDGEALWAGMIVGFHDHGKLKTWYAELREPRTVLGIELPKATKVSVYDGRFETMNLVEPATIGENAGHRFPAGAELSFSDEGKLSSAVVGETFTIRGVPCASYETIRFYPDGSLEEAYLAEDTEIDGVPCGAHEAVRFFENGKLARCYLSREFEIDGVPCCNDTRVYLSDEGRLLEAKPAREIVLDGVPCAAERELALDGKGRLAVAYAATDCTIGGVPCKGDRMIALDEGVLARATLGAEHAFGARTLPAGTDVSFRDGALCAFVLPDGTVHELAPDGTELRVLPGKPDSQPLMHPNGRVKSVWLARVVELDGIPCRADSWIELFEDGKLAIAALARDTKIGELFAKRTTNVFFYETGKVRQLTLASDTVIGGVPCKGARKLSSTINDIENYSEYVRFFATGQLDFATLAKRHEYGGVILEANHSIVLQADGKLGVGTLALDTRIGEHQLAAGTLISLRPDGTFDASYLASSQRHALDVAEI